MMLELHLQTATRERYLPSEQDFRQWVELALSGNKGPAELNIRLVDEAESRSLNREYRGKNSPTNVLSFPFEAPPVVESDLLGDLAICAPVVAREAREQNKPLRSHWAHLVMHGVLHLLGFDHQNEQQAEEMEGVEAGLLARLGIADPYLERTV